MRTIDQFFDSHHRFDNLSGHGERYQAMCGHINGQRCMSVQIQTNCLA